MKEILPNQIPSLHEFYSAAYDGDLSKLQAYISNKHFDINTKFASSNNKTALHWACDRGYKEVAQWLIENGADSNVKEEQFHYSPLHFAVRSGHQDIVRLLIAANADVNAESKRGFTPLMLATNSKQTNLALELISLENTELNHQNDTGDTALHLAVQENEVVIIKKLIAAKVDLQKINKAKQSAIDLAKEKPEILKLLTPTTKPKNLPSYVATLAMKIDSDSDSETSSGEEDRSFPPEYFDEPDKYFRLLPAEEVTKENKKTKPKKYHNRGKIIQAYILPNKDITALPSEKFISTQQKLIKQFSEESFGETPADSLQESKERLSVSMGLNKMRSLSNSRNSALKKAVAYPIDSPVLLKKFGFLWDGIWQEYDSINEKWNIVKYSRVKNFYRALKKYSATEAKIFLKMIEKNRGHMVPYRAIRDEIKNHENTKSLIKHFKTKFPKQDVYMGFFDDDMQSMRSNKIGVMSAYDNLYINSKPIIASTGYVIQAADNPLLELSVLCDLWTRHATAAFIRQGIYYPEPNTIVKVLSDKDTIEENFSITNENEYDTAKEMPILIDHIVKNRKLAPQESLRFNGNHPIITTTPARFDRRFRAVLSKKGEVIHWGLEDLKKMRGLNQSHLNPRKWARNILRAFNIPDKIPIKITQQKTEFLNDKQTIRNVLISLISRLFTAFDPIKIAKTKSQHDNIYFPKSFAEILENYDNLDFVLLPTEREYSEKETIPDQDEARKVTALWKYIDSFNNLDHLKEYIALIFLQTAQAGIGANSIEMAAKAANKKMVELFKTYLCLNPEELIKEALIRFFKSHANNKQINHEQEEKKFVMLGENIPYQMIINNTILDRNRRNALNQLKEMGSSILAPYNITPLHLAAVIGNKEIIRWLISKNVNWINNIQADVYGILPLHLAIRYCADNGIDMELIKLLSNQYTVHFENDSGASASIGIALDELDDPLPIITYLLSHYPPTENLPTRFLITAIENNQHKVVECLIDYCDDDLEADLYEAILDDAPDVNENLIEWGQNYGVSINDIMVELDESDQALFEVNLANAGFSGYSDDEERENDDPMEISEADNDFTEENSNEPANLDNNNYHANVSKKLDTDKAPRFFTPPTHQVEDDFDNIESDSEKVTIEDEISEDGYESPASSP